MDILVLPSHREGLGVVVLEAAACAVPAIMTRCTGASDAVQNGKTGLLVPVGDTAALLRAVDRLRLDPSMRGSLGRSGRERVLREFETSVLLPKLSDFYLKGLSRA
jgi:glycosyltransferase involved in cell wall biosynthesis